MHFIDRKCNVYINVCIDVYIDLYIYISYEYIFAAFFP